MLETISLLDLSKLSVGRLVGDETAQTTRFSPSLCLWDDAHAMTTTARAIAQEGAHNDPNE